MKKIFFTLLITFSIQILHAQGMLNKSKDFVLNAIQKDKTAHLVSAGQVVEFSDFYGYYLINYTRVYKEKGFYPYQASYFYYFNPQEENVCTKYFVTVPCGYFRDMMARIKGFVQVDGTNFRSIDGKTVLVINRSSDPCSIGFAQNYIPQKQSFNKKATQKDNERTVNNDENAPIVKEMIKKFGNYDQINRSSNWDCHDATILKKFSLTTASNFLCKLKFADSLNYGKSKYLLIMVSLNPTDNTCHACAPLLKFLTYYKKGSSWVLSNQNFSVQTGSYGEAPTFEVRALGKTIGFLFTPGFTSQGDTEESLVLYGYFNGTIKELLNIPESSEDNMGACDSTKTNSCYSYTGKIEVISGDKDYNDINFSKKGTVMQNKQVVPVDIIERYQFVNGVYVKSTH